MPDSKLLGSVLSYETFNSYWVVFRRSEKKRNEKCITSKNWHVTFSSSTFCVQALTFGHMCFAFYHSENVTYKLAKNEVLYFLYKFSSEAAEFPSESDAIVLQLRTYLR